MLRPAPIRVTRSAAKMKFERQTNAGELGTAQSWRGRELRSVLQISFLRRHDVFLRSNCIRRKNEI
jgi:hypothetical protein